MFYLIAFSLLISCSWSAEPALAVTENDPSSLVEGVSVITGDLYAFEEDYVIQGAEPIHLRRSYLSRKGRFQTYQHLTANLWCFGNFLTVNEPNGTELSYYPDRQNNVYPVIGKNFYGKDEKKRRVLKYNALAQDDKGSANTKTGEISGKSNLKNQYISFDPNQDGRGKSFTLHAADGTLRRYENYNDQKKTEIPYGGGEAYLIYAYKLVSETLPNGHMIHYRWDQKNQIDRIYTTDASQRTTYCYLDIPVHKAPEIQLTGSDLRSITYYSQDTKSKVASPDFPDQEYGWDLKKVWQGEEIQIPYLTSCTLPKGRTIQVAYDNTYEHRVEKVLAPVGKDDTLFVTHRFFYDPKNKKSHVLDIDDNQTQYFWNDEFRLTQVERFLGQTQPHSSDRFVWQGNLLKCKTFFDEKNSPLLSRTYNYDAWGNVEAETFYGSLSGLQTPDLKINGQGFPIENGIEHYTKKSEYSKDGKNLLLKQEGSRDLTLLYTYWQNTQLPYTKSICEKSQVRIQTIYDYYSDNTLKSEVVEDQHSKVVKFITPYSKGPFIGMPQVLEEREGNGALLRKTVLYYGPGAKPEKKDIYDAQNQLRYSLHFTYDGKGRLTTETNALGQTALYDYDEVGNLFYKKEFTDQLETFYAYDFSNRLIQKEEKGADGIRRLYKYDYNKKHHLISEMDPYGNVTSYTVDAFGHRTEIHLPPIENEAGELVYPVIKQTFDSAGNLILKEDAEGNITKTQYNAYGKPTQIIHPDGTIETFTYFLDGSLETHTDARKVTTYYTYDYLNRILTKTISNQEKQLSQETFSYEGQFLVKKTDAEGNETRYEYDLAGRKKREISLGEETLYSYDEFGRLYKTQKGDLVILTEYDLLDRIVEERNESLSGTLLRQVQYIYDDALNQKTVIRNIQGQLAKEIHQYDSVGRLIRKIDALGFVETWDYNSNINQKTHTDAMGLETIETYNSFNQLSSLEKRQNGKTLFFEKKIYNKNGQPILQIDTIYHLDGTQKEIKTRWEYNSRGWLKTLIEAANTLEAKTTYYTYTPRGELETLTKPNGVVLSYTHSDLGHLESLTSSDQTIHHKMRYNLLGHLQESDGLIRQTDAFGRIKKETFPHGYTLETTYDCQGRKSSCQIPHADCLILYQYDPAHLKSVTRKTLEGITLYTHTYAAYDLSGNITQEICIDQQILQSQYDLLNRKSIIHSFSFSQEITQFDPVGNILQMKRGETDFINYTYDSLYQLTSENGRFTHTYSFDSLNNRLRKDEETYQINSLNQISSHFDYDRNGNPVHCEDTTYTYDALDRLIRIETPNCTRTFTYDFFNRCLSTSATYRSSSETLYFLYDGQNEIGAFNEQLQPIDLRILGNTPHAEIGAAIAIELSGQIHTPIHDLQGNLAVLKPFTSVPTFYHYSAFGEEEILGNALSPWRFSSKRTDDQTHLVYFGRRFYIPSFGRWLTPDPAGFTDGMNLYAYVHNNPLTHIDEYGLIDYGQYSSDWNRKSPIWGTTLSSTLSGLVSREVHILYNDLVQRGLELSFLKSKLLGSSFDDKPWEKRRDIGCQRIDQFFGTKCGNAFGQPDRFLLLGMPCPGNLFSTASKAVSVSRSALSVTSAYRIRGLALQPEMAQSNFQFNRFHQAAYNLSEVGQNNIRILRGWAKSKGWEKLPNSYGGPEKWGVYHDGLPEWRLIIKPEPSLRPGLQAGSNQPRFDARLNVGGSYYVNPFTNEVGAEGIGRHLPLDLYYRKLE